jgi:hypothetical protein
MRIDRIDLDEITSLCFSPAAWSTFLSEVKTARRA